MDSEDAFYSKISYNESIIWGRSGFDGSIEILDACRGAVGLEKKRQTVIGNDNYALAA